MIPNCDIFFNEKMAPRSSFNTGGTADRLLIPHTVDALIKALSSPPPVVVLGGLTNVLISDSGIRGTVILTQGLRGIKIEASTITAAAGEAIKDVVLASCDAGLSGLETFAGLPGTVGGAIFMNARCFGREIANVLAGAKYIEGGKIFDYVFNKADWDYKRSPFNSGRTIIQGTFSLTPYSPPQGAADMTHIKEENISPTSIPLEQRKEALKTLCAHYIKERVDRGHYRYPCAGSVFLNDRRFGRPTGAIIEEAGLKGYRIGGAQVAPYHGNIIINTGGAKSRDIYALMLHIIEVVHSRTGLTLTPEIKLIGDGF